MMKILIVDGLKRLFSSEDSFLGRVDNKVFTASTNEEILAVHIREKLDLIVTKLDLPGAMKSEDLFDIISKSKSLQSVRTIIVCEDSRMGRVRCTQCDADVVLTAPADAGVLQRKMQELLEEAPRHAYRAGLRAVVDGERDGRPVLGSTINISVSGMLMETEDELKEGEPVSLAFLLPDRTAVKAKGEIVRVFKHRSDSHHWKYGVRFTDIDENAKSAIEMFIHKGKSG